MIKEYCQRKANKIYNARYHDPKLSCYKRYIDAKEDAVVERLAHYLHIGLFGNPYWMLWQDTVEIALSYYIPEAAIREIAPVKNASNYTIARRIRKLCELIDYTDLMSHANDMY